MQIYEILRAKERLSERGAPKKGKKKELLKVHLEYFPDKQVISFFLNLLIDHILTQNLLFRLQKQ